MGAAMFNEHSTNIQSRKTVKKQMSVAVPGEPYEGRFYLGDNPVALLLVIGFGSADASGQEHKESCFDAKNLFWDHHH